VQRKYIINGNIKAMERNERPATKKEVEELREDIKRAFEILIQNIAEDCPNSINDKVLRNINNYFNKEE